MFNVRWGNKHKRIGNTSVAMPSPLNRLCGRTPKELLERTRGRGYTVALVGGRNPPYKVEQPDTAFVTYLWMEHIGDLYRWRDLPS